nr:MAG TPA: hypothetical protein [Caudoviricetes sp.]
MYFHLICESVENTTFLKSYNFVTILLLGILLCVTLWYGIIYV